jgi:DNA excision repair protein ERCC-6
MRKSDISQGIAIITTYEGLRKHRQVFSTLEWTGIILDEGQKIRNSSADITETCKMLPAYHRIILSGTPIQNSLLELWSLFDFIYPGRLGALQTFEQEFAVPIRTGAYVNATKLQVELAVRCAMTLQNIVFPYLLRRKKTDVAVIAQLPKKTEHVLFCQISPKQYALYSSFLRSEEVSRVLRKRSPAFRAMMQLRKLCNHPILFELDRLALKDHMSRVDWKHSASEEKKKGKRNRLIRSEDEAEEDDDDMRWLQEEEEGGEEGEDTLDAAQLEDLLRKQGPLSSSLRILWEDSGKLLVLSKILPLWKVEGHKVLIFSQTVLMLTVIEGMVKDMGFSYLRMDGTTPVSKRPSLIHEYNHNPNIYVMLLTTR